MPKKEKKAPKPIEKCPACDLEAGDEMECPNCHQLKRTCCGIAGKSVSCFECEESNGKD